jgi:hypothetical protein
MPGIAEPIMPLHVPVNWFPLFRVTSHRPCWSGVRADSVFLCLLCSGSGLVLLCAAGMAALASLLCWGERMPESWGCIWEKIDPLLP